MTVRTEIRYLRFASMFGRTVGLAQLYHEDGTKMLPTRGTDTPLVQILQYVLDNGLEVTNSQEILDQVVRVNGHAT